MRACGSRCSLNEFKSIEYSKRVSPTCALAHCDAYGRGIHTIKSTETKIGFRYPELAHDLPDLDLADSDAVEAAGAAQA